MPCCQPLHVPGAEGDRGKQDNRERPAHESGQITPETGKTQEAGQPAEGNEEPRAAEEILAHVFIAHASCKVHFHETQGQHAGYAEKEARQKTEKIMRFRSEAPGHALCHAPCGKPEGQEGGGKRVAPDGPAKGIPGSGPVLFSEEFPALVYHFQVRSREFPRHAAHMRNHERQCGQGKGGRAEHNSEDMTAEWAPSGIQKKGHEKHGCAGNGA